MTISATTQGIRPGVCTSTNKPASPFDGQVIYMTDVDQTAVWDGTQWVGTSPIGGRNVIINGSFSVWQRGTTSATTSKTYLADRWARDIPTGGTQSQETDAPSVQFRYSWKHVASATNSYMQLGQQIEFENCKQFQNQPTTISFWAKAVNSNAGSTALTVRTRTIAGGDGACIFAGTAVDTSVTLTTSWAKYTVTRTMPATFGSASIELVLGSHLSGDGFFVTGLQWELGAVATPFESEDYSSLLVKCQRYYWRGGNGSPGIFNGGTTARYSIIFPTTMRTTPVTTAIAAPIVINPTVAEQQTGSQTTGFSVTGFGESVNYSAAQIQLGGFSSGIDGRPTTLLNTALQFSAEF